MVTVSQVLFRPNAELIAWSQAHRHPIRDLSGPGKNSEFSKAPEMLVVMADLETCSGFVVHHVVQSYVCGSSRLSSSSVPSEQIWSKETKRNQDRRRPGRKPHTHATRHVQNDNRRCTDERGTQPGAHQIRSNFGTPPWQSHEIRQHCAKYHAKTGQATNLR